MHREEIPAKSYDKYNGRYWSHLARNGDHWQTVVTTVMNLPGSVKDDNFLICWLLRENCTWDLSRKTSSYECVDELSGLLEPSLKLRELLLAVR